MRNATLLLLALLAAATARAGDEVRDAIVSFKRGFQPGVLAASRAGALRDLAQVRDPEVLDAFDWAFEATVREVRKLLAEKDDATEEVKRLEAEIDAAVMRETEKARKEGRPPGAVSIPMTLKNAADAARREVESLGRRVDEEYDLRDTASEVLGGWIADLPTDDRADVLKDVERGGLRDRDWLRRVFYVRALGLSPVPEATRLLFMRFEDEDDRRVLPVLIDAAADQAGDLALDLILPRLEDERWQIRATAIAALGRIGSEAAVPALIERLRAEDGRLRGDLAAALKKITGQDLGVDADRWQAWWEAHRGDRGKPGPDGGGAPDPAPPLPEGGRASFYGIRIRSKRVLFVIDVSNSMNQEAGGAANRTKLDVAKYELKNAILGLPEGSAFNIIFYHHEVSVWRKGMVEARGSDRRRAVEFVDKIVGDGNTNIHDALDKAFHLVGLGATDKNYDLGADTIFFLSDGRPNRGKIVEPGAILAEVKRWNSLRRVKIHTVGVGPDHDVAFMRALAESSGGTYVNR